LTIDNRPSLGGLHLLFNIARVMRKVPVSVTSEGRECGHFFVGSYRTNAFAPAEGRIVDQYIDFPAIFFPRRKSTNGLYLGFKR